MSAEETRPTPDPTVLTTEQLLREVDRIKELLDVVVRGRESLVDEQFRSVHTQLQLVERQRVEQKEDTKAAVDAALAAAKEAVKEQTTASQLSIGKSEASTKEQLNQQSATFTTALQGMTSALNVLTTRVERIENIKQGGKEILTGIYALGGFLAAAIVVVGALAAAGVFTR